MLLDITMALLVITTIPSGTLTFRSIIKGQNERVSLQRLEGRQLATETGVKQADKCRGLIGVTVAVCGLGDKSEMDPAATKAASDLLAVCLWLGCWTAGGTMHLGVGEACGRPLQL